MLDLKDMNLEELKALENEIQKEIASRQEKPELVLYAHRCKDSSRHHLYKYKHWAKLVTAVDASKTNGYAFAGDFLSVGAEHMIPVGSIVVEVCDTTITAFKMTTTGKSKISCTGTTSMHGLIMQLAQTFQE
jgi:hypothetical protein